MSLEADARRGHEAKAVLDNPIYSESFATVEAEIIRLWRDSRDAADREQLHQLLGLLGKTRNAMESVMRNGEIAGAELARKASKAEQMADAYWTRKQIRG